ANSIVRIPSLINVEQQDLSQDRLGATFAVQWNPTDTTRIALDTVYSKFHQTSDVNQIQSVGLNRNNTNAHFNTIQASATPGGVFPGLNTTSFRTNPHNLEPYDYYNNPGSPGYPGAAAVTAARGLYF